MASSAPIKNIFFSLLSFYFFCGSFITSIKASETYPESQESDYDRIINLPGQPSDPLITQFSGYITVNQDHGRALFYWFFEAQTEPSNKPLLLWLNGGPGCSSIGYGAAVELGPLRVDSNGGLYFNNYTWNKEANLLFVESPVGVGFSYTNTSSDLTILDDEFVAEDAYNFLVNWLQRFPQYKTHDFFIAGESYAGHYVPQLAELVYDRNKDGTKYPLINLKGFIVGNPETDDYYDSEGLLQYAWSHSVISDQVYMRAKQVCDFKVFNWSSECNEAMEAVYDKYREIDIYNIYAPTCLLNTTSSFAHATHESNSIKGKINGLWRMRIPGGYDPCYFTYAQDYFNREEVQLSFHATIKGGNTNLQWKVCNDKDRHRNGVGIVVAKTFVESVVSVMRRGDRIMAIKLVVGESIVNVVSAYAPQIGLDDRTKKTFWDQMDELLREIPAGEKVVIGGDFNGHIGMDRLGYERVHGGHGFGDRNAEGESVLDWAVAFDLVVTNTLYKKREEHLITFKSGSNRSQIDYFLVRNADRLMCKDCKVIPGESLTSQHRILVLDVCIKGQNGNRKNRGSPRTRWWKLKGDELVTFKERMGQEARWNLEDNAEAMWNTMAGDIKKVAREVLGESKGKGPISKETWWWNEGVQAAIKTKKECFRRWQKDRNDDDFRSYKIANKEAKKAVGEAKSRAYNDFYAKLDTKEGEKRIYKLAKWRERKTRDFNQVRCIKSDDARVLVRDDEIKDRWKGYFEKLLNAQHGGRPRDGEVDDGEDTREYLFYRRIGKSEIERALRKMKSNKAVGPDGIPIEVWKYLGEKGVTWLVRLFNKILMSRKMPNEWRKSILVPIYKNKGDVQDCNNYRGIKLMGHTMKLWERVMETRLRAITTISENQFGFMPGRSTIEAIHLLRRLMEKYREKKRDLHMVFIDLEKAYDRVPRDLIWWVLERRGVTRGYIDVIRDMYEGVMTSIRLPAGETSEFPITVGLHQGSALSPYLFALVMDEMTRNIQDDVPWCMLFADDIVLVDETKSGVNAKLEVWRAALELRGFRISRTKTEYLECNFSGNNSGGNEAVAIESQELPTSDHFRYLGSIITKLGEIGDDVTHRIKASWLKWRGASGVLCDRRIPAKLKGKFYRTAIRPVMLYGSECWATKKQHVDKMHVAEMRMLRWMCGKTRKDRVRNDHIREMVGVAPIEDKLRENRLRWFGHLYRRPREAVVRRGDEITVNGTARGRGRPKLTWANLINRDLTLLNMTDDMALDRAEWRKRIHAADPILNGN